MGLLKIKQQNLASTLVFFPATLIIMNEVIIPLRNHKDTITLSRDLAWAITQKKLRVILLKGELGAGKTTLVRHIVSFLPGGEKAEVSSPSFTIQNIYSTKPLVCHFDLYRLDPFYPDESLDEALDDDGVIVIIEWSERLPDDEIPDDFLTLSLSISDKKGTREAKLSAKGFKSTEALKYIHNAYK